MESLLGAIIGIGLAASCGFRVFVPLLIVGVAARSGYLELAEGFAWMGTWPALVAFAVATAVEIAAYYVPWLDNLLDTVASPAAVVAGTVLLAAFLTDFDPFLQWSLAIIAGGGSAGLVQAGTVATRLASTAAIAHDLLNEIIDRKAASLSWYRLPLAGNLDAEAIREVCRLHGVDETVDPQAKGGAKLDTVKEKRNSLAHGHESFVEVGRNVSAHDLMDAKNEVVAFIRGILKNLEKFATTKTYRLATVPPAPAGGR